MIIYFYKGIYSIRLHVVDLVNEMNEAIEIGERIINMTMGYDHLIFTTPTQCYVYNVNVNL